MSKQYSFDEATHTHRIGDVIVPGITTLLKPLYNFDSVPRHILQAACDFGSALHRTIELYCYDNLDEENLDPALNVPLSVFKDWMDAQGFSRSDFIVEVPMADPKLMVACIPDLIIDGKLIVEIKTRKPNLLTDSIQTCCQEHIWKQNGGAKTKEYERRVLYLGADGSIEYVKVNHNQAMSRFRKLLEYYWTGRMIESWKM